MVDSDHVVVLRILGEWNWIVIVYFIRIFIYTNILLNSFAREHLHRPHGAHVQEQSVWFTEVKQIAQTEDRVTAFGEEKSSLTFRRMPSRSAN